MLTSGVAATTLSARIAASIRSRTPVAQRFFAANAEAIARAAHAIAERLSAGGRIYAFGRAAYATDAQHVAVEFVHPVLVGKPALPASDVSLYFEGSLPALICAADVVFGFGPPGGDPVVARALAQARALGTFALALPGSDADFAIDAVDLDEHIHQEIVEITGHLIYESVHVFLEHRPHADDVGAAAFLYPFLGGSPLAPDALIADVVTSIRQIARVAEALRERIAHEESDAVAAAVTVMAREIAAGGRLLLIGNGGSATDATDFALDCLMPPPGLRPVPALSLAAEPATITAIANDVGREYIFLRQLIAHIRPHDVLVALSTSGGSLNVIAALGEARKRGHRSVALLGYDGGEIRRRDLADHAIVVRCDYVPRVQEAQAAIYHTMRHAIGWLRDEG
jgi:D-sedoheptulose 7-phosphate isomerase